MRDSDPRAAPGRTPARARASDDPHRPAAGDGYRRITANDRLKQRFGGLFWGGIIAATIVHFAVFLVAPPMSVADLATDDDAPELIDIPEIDLPEPPAELSPPAKPVFSDVEVSDDVTIPRNTFDDTPLSELPPPPADDEAGDPFGGFVPVAVAPELRNPDEVRRTLRRSYPRMLRDAGIGGRVDLRLWIDEEGVVVRARVHRSSGRPQLDRAALDIAETMRFSPALNRDRRVPVTAIVPVTFRAR